MADAPAFDLDLVSRLTDDQVAAVSGVIERATDVDGMRPVSEHVWLHLQEGGDEGGLHLLARDVSGALVGYAHLDVTDEVEGPSAEVAVDPSARRLGLGRLLVEDLIRRSPDGRMRLWAHGEQAGAAELATSLGFRRTRVLWQMRRSLFAPLPRPALPEGVEVRPFAVGVDEAAWLDLNARAFAHLPDQGGWAEADLLRREREPWFEPAGFLVAWRGSRMVGYHWTKVHGSTRHRTPGSAHFHQHEPIGEVYVVGVDPAERGTGLGRSLTLLGLAHLRAKDLAQAMLYVDATNTPAIALYESLGFARWDTDVLFRREP